MVSFRDALVNGIRNAYCQMLGTGEAFLNQYFPTIGALPNPGLGAARFAQRLVCDREPPNLPSVPPVGGQCPGVLYSVDTFVGITFNGSTSNDFGFPDARLLTSLPGPIRGLFDESDGNDLRLRLRYGPSNDFVDVQTLPNGIPNGYAWQFYSITQIIREDGLPDDCGNGDPDVDPPPNNYNVFNIPIEYTDINNNNIVVPINLVFAPVAIGNNNLIQIPFNINAPIDFGLNLNGTLNLPDGDINFNFGGGNGVSGSDDCPPPQSDLPDDTPPIPPDVPDDVPPVDPDEIPQVIRGAIVTTSFVPENTSVYFQDDIPDLYLPRLGNVQFLIEIDGKLAWSEAIDVNNKRQLVLCPWEGGAIRVDGFPRPGIIWDITPVYDLSSLPIPVRPYVQP